MKLLSHIDRRGEPATVPGVALRGKRLFEPTPPSEQQQLAPTRSADPSPINVLRQLHALNAEHSGMKAKHARLLAENTRLHADNKRLHADVTRLAAQAAQKVGLYMGGDGTLIAEKNVSALPAVIFRPNLYA